MKLEASIDEIAEPVNGEYFEGFKVENQEITMTMEYDEGVTVIEILVDVENVATILSEEVMET